MNVTPRNVTVALAVSLVLFALALGAVEVRGDGADAIERAADLAAPVRLIDADHPVAAPFVADVDGDGKSELIVGEFRRDAFTEAGFRVYRRLGKPSELKFDAGSWLQAAGRDATVPAFCYTGSAPQIVDYNGDGIPDLVSPAMIGKQHEAVLRVFPGLGKGRFGKPTEVTYLNVTDSSPCLSCYNVRAFVYDWDGDGTKDILAATSGGIWVVGRSSGRNANQYAAPKPLSVNGKPLSPSLTSLCMADWDGDGRDDMIVGDSRGSVQWYRNTSLQGEPKLAAGVTLIPPSEVSSVRYRQSESYPTPQRPARSVRVYVADMTGDGRVDLIVGDWNSATAVGPKPTKEQAMALEAAERRMKAARDALQKLMSLDPPVAAEARVLHDGKLEARLVECRSINHEIRQLLHERHERHGSVWLFQRLAK